MNIPRIVDEWARKVPDRLAHISGPRTLTYGELRRASDTLAAHLARTLAGDRSPVAIRGHKEPEMVVGFLGAAKAGHPYVPIDSALPRQRVERIIETAACRMTLTPPDIAALSAGDGAPPAREPAPSDPYYVMFTSGSTGEPKGVVITTECLAAFLGWITAEHGFTAGEVFLNAAPYSFDLSVMDTYPALVSGGTVFSIGTGEVEEPKRLFAALRRSGITTWVSTPSFARMCLAERSFGTAMLPAVRRFLFCGEVLPSGVATELLDRFPAAAVWNTYGPTEATVATTSVRLDPDIVARHPALPVGRPMPGTQVLVVDESGRPVRPGERGEIVIVGPNVGAGYVGQSGPGARAFVEIDGRRAYRTGDRGHYEEEWLFCDGRLDDQVKLRGYRVELGDVEANLRQLAEVRDAVILPVTKRGRVDSLAAFVVLAGPVAARGADLTRMLRARLAARLPAYMLPRKFVVLDAFPLTANSKPDRRRLAALLDDSVR